MSFTVQTRSAFKCLLAGLLVSLLVLSSHALPANANRRSLTVVESSLDGLEVRAPVSVRKTTAREKATPKKAPAKAPTVKKASTKKAPAKNSVPNKGHAVKKGGVVAAACPTRKPNKKLSKRSLYKRSGPTSHPPGAFATTLFHGSTSEANAVSAAKVDLSKTNPLGDYHRAGRACDGGFYLTDSLFAAAQFVCHTVGQPPRTTAYVNEYTWTPPAGMKHQAYTKAGKDVDSQAAKDCQTHDLLEGPMDGPFDTTLHKDFYQYTITNQKTAAGLQHVKHYTIPCANIQSGKNLDSELYQKGQKSNQGFSVYANMLEGKC